MSHLDLLRELAAVGETPSLDLLVNCEDPLDGASGVAGTGSLCRGGTPSLSGRFFCRHSRNIHYGSPSGGPTPAGGRATVNLEDGLEGFEP